MAKRILAVDDHNDSLSLIGFACEQAGFAFTAAHNQHEMQVALAREVPDLLILDVLLPGCNGYQVIEALHRAARTRAIPIIVISKRGETLYRRMSADLGVAFHLTKPFNPETLVAHARTIFGEIIPGIEPESGAPFAR